MDGSLVSVGNNFAGAIGYLRAISPQIATGVLNLCRNGATIDAALAQMNNLVFERAEDAAWWRDRMASLREYFRNARLMNCTYTPVPFLEQDLFALVASRAQRGGSTTQFPGGGGTLDPPRPDQVPPIPPLNPRPDHDDHDHTDEDPDVETGNPVGGSDCGSGCCGGKCGEEGGCAWRPPWKHKGPCLFDKPMMKPIDVRYATAIPGRANCEPLANNIAPCQIKKIIRQSERFFVSGSTLLGTLVVVTPDENHVVPAGFTMYALTIPGIALSHKLCLRRVEITVTPAVGPAVIVPTDQIGLEVEKLFCDTDGGFVDALDWIKWEDPDYIRITDGRCECDKLCVCVPHSQPTRVVFMIPTPVAASAVSVTVRGKRECFGIVCGACPPEPLCGRTLAPLPATPIPGIVGLNVDPLAVIGALAKQFPNNPQVAAALKAIA